MKKTLIYCGLILMLGCLTSVAWADYYSRQFGDMDLSRDDFVDLEEYRYYVSGATIEAFKTIDFNQDEKIDFFEWVEFQEKDYPFKSRRGFNYKGQTGNWHVDRHGNRHKGNHRYYHRHLYDCCYDHRYDGWPRHHCGMYWESCGCCMSGGLAISAGIRK